MNIILQSKSGDQEGRTLDQFLKGLEYQDLPDDIQEFSRMMQELLWFFQEHVVEPDKWAFVAMHYVTLRDPENQNGIDARISTWRGQYRIEHPWHTNNPPWPKATIQGSAIQASQAAEMILVVLKSSTDSDDHPSQCANSSQQSSSLAPPARVRLKRILEQQPESLEDYYTRLSQEQQRFPPELSRNMLTLIRYLEAEYNAPIQWCYTSSENLILVDSEHSKTGIEIAPRPGGYRITYPSSPPETLWKNARVIGYAPNEVEAAKMLHTAIQRTLNSRLGI